MRRNSEKIIQQCNLVKQTICKRFTLKPRIIHSYAKQLRSQPNSQIAANSLMTHLISIVYDSIAALECDKISSQTTSLFANQLFNIQIQLNPLKSTTLNSEFEIENQPQPNHLEYFVEPSLKFRKNQYYRPTQTQHHSSSKYALKSRPKSKGSIALLNQSFKQIESTESSKLIYHLRQKLNQPQKNSQLQISTIERQTDAQNIIIRTDCAHDYDGRPLQLAINKKQNQKNSATLRPLYKLSVPKKVEDGVVSPKPPIIVHSFRRASIKSQDNLSFLSIINATQISQSLTLSLKPKVILRKLQN